MIVYNLAKGSTAVERSVAYGQHAVTVFCEDNANQTTYKVTLNDFDIRQIVTKYYNTHY
jgi:hypothetical protein